jgi:hypothetical protein
MASILIPYYTKSVHSTMIIDYPYYLDQLTYAESLIPGFMTLSMYYSYLVY